MNRLACSLLLISFSLSAVSNQNIHSNSHSRPLKPRQLPFQTGSSSLSNALFDPTSSNRSLDPSKITPATPTPADPAVSSPVSPSLPSTSPSTSPSLSLSPKDPSLGDSLLPLLGTPPSPGTPNPSPSLTPTNSIRPFSPSSTSLTPPSSPTTPTPLSPSRGQSFTTDLSTASIPSLSPSPSPTDRTSRIPPHKSDDTSSGFGATTIKLMGIIAAIVAGLFLLWTVIRKWKFRPSKRFAKKLDDYDHDVFTPRPPSFAEKRGNDFQAYSIPTVPNRSSAFVSQYPSYPERSASPLQKLSYGNDSHGPQAYHPHRLSHISITQPPAMFEPNPYRLSLGLGNPTHAYPPFDQPKPTVM